MAPVRRACESDILRATAASDLAQRSLNELARVRDQSGGLADLRHGRGNEMRLHALHVDAVGLEFRAERCGPLLQECFAAGVGC